MGLLIAPTEPDELKALGKVALLPEKFGADVLWSSQVYGLCGVQRKTIPDLISSLHDGRLAKEVGQMQRLGIRALVVEGEGQWTTDGKLLNQYAQRWSLQSHQSLLWSVQSRGIWVLPTRDLPSTCDSILNLYRWTASDSHHSLDVRPKSDSPWPKSTETPEQRRRRQGIHLLQSFDGVGIGLAGVIYDYFGGVPLQSTVSLKELMAVPGVGKKTAEAIVASLCQLTSNSETPSPSPTPT